MIAKLKNVSVFVVTDSSSRTNIHWWSQGSAASPSQGSSYPHGILSKSRKTHEREIKDAIIAGEQLAVRLPGSNEKIRGY